MEIQDGNYVDRDFQSRTVNIFRFCVIILMMSTHIPWNSDYGFMNGNLTGHVDQKIVLYIQDGLGRASSAGLAIISGWFVSLSIEKKSRMEIANSRIKSLGFPYFFWCLAYGIPASVVVSRFDILKILGIGQWPMNEPLHFLRDLLITAIVYLLISKILGRNKFAILFTGFLFWILCIIFGNGIGIDDNSKSILVRPSIILMFFAGVASVDLYRILFTKKSVDFFCSNIVFLALFSMSVLCFLAISYINYHYSQNIRHISVFSISISMLSNVLRLIESIFILSFSIKIATIFPRLIANKRMIFHIFCSHYIIISFMRISILDADQNITMYTYFFFYASAIIFGIFVHYSLYLFDNITGFSLSRYI